jgi:hypothetical protein
MSKSTTVFKIAQHIKLETHSQKEAEDLLHESQEKCAIGIGLQLLKRKLITFETEENPGANAGERKISITGTVIIGEPKAE